MPHVNRSIAAAAALLLLAGCQSSSNTVQQALDPAGQPAAPAPATATATAPVPVDVAAAQPPRTDTRITEDELRGYCPQVILRENTGYYNTYTNKEEKSPDDVIYQASIGEVTRSCSQANGVLNMKVAAAGRVVAGPKGKNGTITMPIRVAVLEGSNVVYSQLTQHKVQIDTAAGATQFLVADENVSVPIAPGTRYRVYVGYDEGPYNTP
jgi:hypothetical protein